MEEGEDGREKGAWKRKKMEGRRGASCMEGQMVRVREGAWEGEGCITLHIL
jgi:hypothetical protein